MKKLIHHHPRFWVLLSVVFAIVTPLTLTVIAGGFTIKLKEALRTELTNQLTSSMERLEAANYNEKELEALEDAGTHILVFDSFENAILYRSRASTHITDVYTGTGASAASGQSAESAEVSALLTLVHRHLGNEDGSFLVSNGQVVLNQKEESLESQDMLLCWRKDSLVCCLSLPIKSTNEAIKHAIFYTQSVSGGVLIIFLIIFVCLAKQISRRYQRIADMTSRMAKLDFSRRCPEYLTREMNDLRMSINTMADALEEHVNALRTANEKLNTELAERTRQQRIATDLMGNLAHDLKTPIAIVSGYAEGLSEGLAKTPEKQQRYYDSIMLESSHMQEIVTRILALGRMENGETPISPRDFDLRVLLNEILSSFQREVERQGLRLTRFIDGDCMVHSDYDCVRQSLINYVQNAIYHINDGNRIEVRTVDRGSSIRVRVVNSSAPISSEKSRKIWDKLYRGDPSRQRKHGEMGLGLSIVKSNMERLGHAYGVENAPDFPGVCFWLELPKANPAKAKQNQPKQEKTF